MAGARDAPAANPLQARGWKVVGARGFEPPTPRSRNTDPDGVFTEELEHALQIIAALPGAGTLYVQSPVPGVRRVYLRRVAVHLYYTFDNAHVIVRALWGARCERGPRI